MNKLIQKYANHIDSLKLFNDSLEGKNLLHYDMDELKKLEKNDNINIRMVISSKDLDYYNKEFGLEETDKNHGLSIVQGKIKKDDLQYDDFHEFTGLIISEDMSLNSFVVEKDEPANDLKEELKKLEEQLKKAQEERKKMEENVEQKKEVLEETIDRLNEELNDTEKELIELEDDEGDKIKEMRDMEDRLHEEIKQTQTDIYNIEIYKTKTEQEKKELEKQVSVLSKTLNRIKEKSKNNKKKEK